MFIKAEDFARPVKKPEKIILRAPASEKDRLLRRASELFPGILIGLEEGEQFFLATAPASAELAGLEQKFSARASQLDPELKAQAHLLSADDNRVAIFAGGGPGLFYGMQSLHEMIQRQAGPAELFDAPIYPRRGFLQDLSRGQVLALAGFDRLVKALAHFRLNWLTFNLEHNFGSERHPEISELDDVFTQAEAKTLFELCREYYLEAVPMQQSFGHLRGILSHPKYRHLAFDDQLLWSLDPRKDEIYPLLADLYQEQAECFPGKYFLVGCDEPFDLKKKWKPEMGNGKTFPQVYLEHLLKLHRIVSGLGRRMMVWGDMFVEHPELLPQLPEDLVIINWQYGSSNQESEEFYETRTKTIAQSGREFYAATATWSYARLFPEHKTMEFNNRNFLKVGARLGASGALLTNWGDLGHIQLLGYLPMAIGYFGVQCWRPSDLTLEQFAPEFALNFFNDPTGKAAALYLLFDRVNQVVSPVKFFGGSALFVLLDDLFSNQYLPPLPAAEVANQLLKIVREAETITSGLVQLKNIEWVQDLKPIIYSLGLLFTKFLIAENAPLILSNPSKKEEMFLLVGQLSNYFQNFAGALRDKWLEQAKPRGLERALRRLLKVVEGYQKRLVSMEQGKMQSWPQFRDAPEFAEYKFNLLKEMGLEELL